MPTSTCAVSLGLLVSVLLKSAVVWGTVHVLLRLLPDLPAATRCQVLLSGAAALAVFPALELGMALLGLTLPLAEVPGIELVTSQPRLPPAGFLSAGIRESPSAPALGVLGMVWLGGLLVIVTRYALDVTARRRVEQGCRGVGGVRNDHLRMLQAQLGTGRAVRLVEHESLSMPLTWGWRRPVIVLPMRSRQWPTAMLLAALRHELAHIERSDHLVRLLLHVQCALGWFNPFLWWMASRLRLEQERSCDDAVLRMGVLPSAYSRDLLAIARAATRDRWQPISAAGTHQSALHARIQAIVDGDRARTWPTRRFSLLVVASVLAVSLLVASAEPGRSDARQALLRQLRSPSTGMLLFSVPSPSHVQVELFDVTGSRVALLFDGLLSPGLHEFPVHGADVDRSQLEAGTYFCRLAIGTDLVQVRRIQL
ncbi:MAG: M56 family metallopeptidase [Candidatus Latescibacterota bacterium]|jgi:beta-lactamase regulating signal transducer with metallopeptidase domain